LSAGFTVGVIVHFPLVQVRASDVVVTSPWIKKLCSPTATQLTAEVQSIPSRLDPTPPRGTGIPCSRQEWPFQNSAIGSPCELIGLALVTSATQKLTVGHETAAADESPALPARAIGRTTQLRPFHNSENTPDPLGPPQLPTATQCDVVGHDTPARSASVDRGGDNVLSIVQVPVCWLCGLWAGEELDVGW
jgi:hypothetical protein